MSNVLVANESASVLYPRQLNYPEGVTVDGQGRIWAGGADGEIYCLRSDLFVVPVATITGRILGLCPSLDGGVVACAMDEHRVIKVDSKGTVTQVGPATIPLPNCAAYDTGGALWVTNSGSWDEADGTILRIDPDGHTETVLTELHFPNGLAFSADFTQLFVAQSTARDVIRIDLSADGTPGNISTIVPSEMLADSIAGDLITDGLAVDEADNLYIALPRVDKVAALTPSREIVVVLEDNGPAKDTTTIESGQVLRSPTNIAFGGTDRRDLLVSNLRTRHLTCARSVFAGVPLPGQAGVAVGS